MSSYFTSFQSGVLFILQTPLWVHVMSLPIWAVLEYQQVIIYTYATLLGTLAIVKDTQPDRESETNGVISAHSSATLLNPTKPAPRASASSSTTTPTSDVEDSPSVKSNPHYLIARKPLTGNTEATLKHLSTIGGRWGSIRGYGLLMMLGMASDSLATALTLRLGGSYTARKFSYFLVGVASAPLQMTWTHIVISKPTGQWFWQRIQWRSTHAVLLPTAVWATFLLVADLLQLFLLDKLGLPNHLAMLSKGYEGYKEYQGNAQQNIAALVLGFVAHFCLKLFVHVPGDIILARCQAALLSEEETPIIRLDRTFGGRVRNGSLSVLDAWRSFGHEAWRRLAMTWLRALLRLATLWSMCGPFLVAAFFLSQHLKTEPKTEPDATYKVEGFGLFDD